MSSDVRENNKKAKGRIEKYILLIIYGNNYLNIETKEDGLVEYMTKGVPEASAVTCRIDIIDRIRSLEHKRLVRVSRRSYGNGVVLTDEGKRETKRILESFLEKL